MNPFSAAGIAAKFVSFNVTAIERRGRGCKASKLPGFLTCGQHAHVCLSSHTPPARPDQRPDCDSRGLSAPFCQLCLDDASKVFRRLWSSQTSRLSQHLNHSVLSVRLGESNRSPTGHCSGIGGHYSRSRLWPVFHTRSF